jgi:SAM-dependent methyltransferase
MQRGVPDDPAAVQPRRGVTRMFASAVPGATPIITRELKRLPGVQVTEVGFDGRADLILFEADRAGRESLSRLRSVEDLFVEVGRTARSAGDNPSLIARRVWRPGQVEKALSAWSQAVRPLAGAMTYRVIARVRQERSFRRTALRDELSRSIAGGRPRWKAADPAQIEVWIGEYRPGHLVAGLRLSDGTAQRRAGTEAERPGALRPSVAAMMVGLAGQPRRNLLDPCCGSGAILGQALAAGWSTVRGIDMDPAAVVAAGRHAPGATVWRGDARELTLPAGSVAAVVSALPAARAGSPAGQPTWLAEVLAEVERITRPGGRVVLLTPEIPAGAIGDRLKITARRQLRLSGTTTTLWGFDRL